MSENTLESDWLICLDTVVRFLVEFQCQLLKAKSRDDVDAACELFFGAGTVRDVLNDVIKLCETKKISEEMHNAMSSIDAYEDCGARFGDTGDFCVPEEFENLHKLLGLMLFPNGQHDVPGEFKSGPSVLLSLLEDIESFGYTSCYRSGRLNLDDYAESDVVARISSFASDAVNDQFLGALTDDEKKYCIRMYEEHGDCFPAYIDVCKIGAREFFESVRSSGTVSSISDDICKRYEELESTSDWVREKFGRIKSDAEEAWWSHGGGGECEIAPHFYGVSGFCGRAAVDIHEALVSAFCMAVVTYAGKQLSARLGK